jgi:hypothetical protein
VPSRPTDFSLCAVPCATFLDFLIIGGLSAARWAVAGDLLPSRLAVESEPLVVHQFATALWVWHARVHLRRVVLPEANSRCLRTTWSSPTLLLDIPEIPEDLQQKLNVGSRIVKHVVDLLNFCQLAKRERHGAQSR